MCKLNKQKSLVVSVICGAYFICQSGLSQDISFATTNRVPDILNVISIISIPDPVDVKWAANSNLYVLSGQTATITEFDGAGKIICSLKLIGSAPSGFDVDGAGNVYVAVSGDNQVLKFNQTQNSLVLDTRFGKHGFIGNSDKSVGSNPATFNHPIDVAVTSDGQEISVSDSANNRVQRFTKDGGFIESFGNKMNVIGTLKVPSGLVYDVWNNLFITDSGNNRIVIVSDYGSEKASGEAGTSLGQFQTPYHLCCSKRGVYVADTGNNRVQVFAPSSSHELLSKDNLRQRLEISAELKLSHPQAVAAVTDLLQEKIYIADTGNNRVILVNLPLSNPEEVWKRMREYLEKGDIAGAISCFSSTSSARYLETFRSLSKAKLISDARNLGSIKPVSIESEKAQYYFDSVVNGQKTTFPIEFIKENGTWKISEY